MMHAPLHLYIHTHSTSVLVIAGIHVLYVDLRQRCRRSFLLNSLRLWARSASSVNFHGKKKNPPPLKAHTNSVIENERHVQ